MPLSLNQVLKQTQKLVMTPQMQQSIQLLQLNSMELEQLTRQEMMENPFLELAADEENSTEQSSEQNPSLSLSQEQSDTRKSESASTDQNEPFQAVDMNWDEYYEDSENKAYFPPEDGDEKDFNEFVASRTSLYEYLMWQLQTSGLEGKDFEIGKYLVGNINDEGYLEVTTETAGHDLGVEPSKVEQILRVIQTFDPVGVGARDLKECLRLQLIDRGVKDPLPYQLLEQHFDLLRRKKFSEIARALGTTEDRVVQAFHTIARLEPKPGRVKTKEQPNYITPDVVVKKIDNRYLYYLNEGSSTHLKVSSFYRKLLSGNNRFSPEEKEYAQEKYRAAVWLIRNIEKRKSTILKITEAIMKHQKDFLEKGIEHLKPLTLREIAEGVGMHESTVARVTTNKYAETPQGTFELKFFFSSGLKRENGETTSSRSVKEQLSQLISEENPGKPYSDQRLVELLRERGIQIARRTVAKYREQLKILPANMRKSV
jgi:RNA polymerase sigma-54 factor